MNQTESAVNEPAKKPVKKRRKKKKQPTPQRQGLRQQISAEEVSDFLRMHSEGCHNSEILNAFHISEEVHRELMIEHGISSAAWAAAVTARVQLTKEEFERRQTLPTKEREQLDREKPLNLVRANEPIMVKSQVIARTTHNAMTFRKRFKELLTSEDFDDIVESLITIAREGNLEAIKEVFNRTMGKPTEGTMRQAFEDELMNHVNLENLDDDQLRQFAGIIEIIERKGTSDEDGSVPSTLPALSP